jgi:c-di-GMP-binding flagellar brake protein YcgR
MLRSPGEIAGYLSRLAHEQAAVSTVVSQSGSIFAGTLRYVDPNHEYIVVGYGADPAANGAILAVRSATFSISRDSVHVEFIATRPVDVYFDGTYSVRFDFPTTLTLNRRRTQQRMPVIPFVLLRCVADTRGFLSFESTVIDISRGGLGTLICGDTILLEQGTVLQGCEIDFDGDVIEVDIEIRYSTLMDLPDGSKARRSGCRFVNTTAKADELIGRLIRKIENPAGGDNTRPA